MSCRYFRSTKKFASVICFCRTSNCGSRRTMGQYQAKDAPHRQDPQSIKLQVCLDTDPLMYYYQILFLLTQLLCQQNQTFWLVAQLRAVYGGYAFAFTTMTVMSNWHQFDLHNCVLLTQTLCQQETTYCDDTHSILSVLCYQHLFM